MTTSRSENALRRHGTIKTCSRWANDLLLVQLNQEIRTNARLTFAEPLLFILVNARCSQSSLTGVFIQLFPAVSVTRPEIADNYGRWLAQLQFEGIIKSNGTEFTSYGIVYVPDPFESRE